MYNAETMAELKEMLRERSLLVSGRKPELVDRLTSHDAEHGTAKGRTNSSIVNVRSLFATVR